MSLRIDTSEWISGALVIGDEGLGVLGSDIPSTGDNGPGYAYNDLSMPADAGKEICGRITTWPTNGTLFAFENTSFTYVPAGDGADSFQYQLYVDGVAVGSPTTVSLQSGAGAATALGMTLTATSSLTAGTATGASAGTAPGATLTATSSLSAGLATGTAPGTAPGATLTATASLTAGSASGQRSETAAGVTLTGTASLIAGVASAAQYARAPSGSGYRPQRSNVQTRPANVQRNNR
jgi:hypothetical protein